MLVLTRFPEQKIIIGDNVKVSILSVNGNQVKIGIEAPRDLAIYREEVYQKVKKANLEEKEK